MPKLKVFEGFTQGEVKEGELIGPVRVGPLEKHEQIRRELGRVYRMARRRIGQDMSTEDASRLAFVLTAISKNIENIELEARLTALEQRLLRGR